MGSILYDYTPTELQQLLDNSDSYSDVLRKAGLNPKGNNPETLKRIIKEYNLSTTKLNENRSKLFSRCAYIAKSKSATKLEDVFSGKVKMQSTKLLKRLISERYKVYKCEICGVSEWMGKYISLQLHHKDGDHNNNSLENLQILCPNCHSQTSSYAGKNSHKHRDKKKNINKKNDPNSKVLPISREDLKTKIRNIPFTKIAEEYSVTDNAIRRWCDKYKLPRHSRVINKICDADWENI